LLRQFAEVSVVTNEGARKWLAPLAFKSAASVT